jgi:O-acetylserine/cysteine efflux transporter
MTRKDMAIALWVVMIWSLNLIVLKIAVFQLPILVLTFLRVALVFPLLFFFPKPEKSLWKYFLCGFFLLALYLLLFGLGLKSDIAVGLSAFFLQTHVLFVILCCFFILGEKPTWFQVTGLLISFVGVYLLKISSLPEQIPIEGIIFLLASCASYGIGIALAKKHKIGNSMSDVTWLSMAAAVPLFFVSIIFEGPLETFYDIIHMSLTVILCLIFATLFSTIWATYLWLSLLQKVPASSVAPFMLLLPIFSIILSYIFMGENVTSIQMISGGFIVLGVMFAQGLHQRIPLFLYWVKSRMV